jgi:hypothetical protein
MDLCFWRKKNFSVSDSSSDIVSCRKCNFRTYIKRIGESFCQLTKSADSVTGLVRIKSCLWARENEEACGKSGKWFSALLKDEEEEIEEANTLKVD